MGWRTAPAAGLILTAISLVVAISLVPKDVEPAGTLFVPSLALAVGLIAAPCAMIWSASASIGHPVNIVAMSPVYWLLLDMLQTAYDLKDINSADVQAAYLAIALFSSAVWIAAIQRPWPLPKVVRDAASFRLTNRQLYGIAALAFALAFLRYAIPCNFDPFVMVGAFSKGRWSAPWARGDFGGWDAFLDHLTYFGYVVPAIAVLLARRDGWLSWRTLSCAGFSAILMAFASTGGGRRIVGVMGGSAMLAWFLSARPPRLRHLLMIAGVTLVLLILMQLVLYSRNQGLSTMLSAEKGSETGRIHHLHVDDNFLRVCQVIQVIPEYRPYVTWRWLVWVAARPVPRVFWPGKPLDPGFTLAGYYHMKGVSISMSLIGEAYMAFGFLGVFVVGWCLGRIAKSLALVLESSDAPGAFVIFGSGLMALFVGMRSGIELVLMSYAVLAWIGLVWIYRQTAGPAHEYRPAAARRPNTPGDARPRSRF